MKSHPPRWDQPTCPCFCPGKDKDKVCRPQRMVGIQATVIALVKSPKPLSLPPGGMGFAHEPAGIRRSQHERGRSYALRFAHEPAGSRRSQHDRVNRAALFVDKVLTKCRQSVDTLSTKSPRPAAGVGLSDGPGKKKNKNQYPNLNARGRPATHTETR